MTPGTHTHYGFIQPGMVSIEDYESIKRVALSVMSTLENIMDDETTHISRIKALESENSKLKMKIFNIEGREDVVMTELRHQLNECKMRYSDFTDIKMQEDMMLYKLRDEVKYYKERFGDKEKTRNTDSELLNKILKIVNPFIKGGVYKLRNTRRVSIIDGMQDVCRVIIAHRRKHGIVG